MIARPFALIGFTLTLALAVLNIIEGAALILVPFAVCSLAICLFGKGIERRGVYSAVMLSVILACAVYSLHESYIYTPTIALEGDAREVFARIVSLPAERNGRLSYTLFVEQIDGIPCKGKLLLKLDQPLDAQAYDYVSLKGQVYSIANEHEDLMAYYKAKGVFWQCFDCAEYTVTECKAKPIGYWLLEAKDYIRQRLGGLMRGDRAALAVGMLTGDTDLLSDESYLAFRRTGLSHVLSVSGLHMSVIVLSLYKLLCSISRRYIRLWSAVCIAVAIIYSGVSGFSQSVVRSCIMVCVLFAGRLISRRADTLNSLGFAAFCIAFFNPYAVVDWSFMLSFSSTLGIVLMSKPIDNFSADLCAKVKPPWLAAALKKLINASGISIAATVFCLPVTVFCIGYISLVFLPANILTMYAVSLELILSLLCVVPMGPVSQVPTYACTKLSDYILTVVYWLADFRYAGVKLDSGFAKIVLAAALLGVVISVWLIKDRARLVRVSASVLCGAIALTAGCSLVMQADRVDIVYTKSCVVITKEQSAVVIGCDGNALKSADEILYNNSCEDVVLILPQLADKTFNKERLFFEKYNVKNVILSEKGEILASTADYEITDSTSFDFYNMKIIYTPQWCSVEAQSGKTAVVFDEDKMQDLDADYIILPELIEGGERLFSYNKFGIIEGGEEIGGFN